MERAGNYQFALECEKTLTKNDMVRYYGSFFFKEAKEF